MSISSALDWTLAEYDPPEFGTDKLSKRGTAQARAIVTTVQDFLLNLWHNLGQE